MTHTFRVNKPALDRKFLKVEVRQVRVTVPHSQKFHFGNHVLLEVVIMQPNKYDLKKKQLESQQNSTRRVS